MFCTSEGTTKRKNYSMAESGNKRGHNTSVLYKAHESSRAWARYAKHIKETKRLAQNVKCNYGAKLAECAKNQPKYTMLTSSQEDHLGRRSTH